MDLHYQPILCLINGSLAGFEAHLAEPLADVIENHPEIHHGTVLVVDRAAFPSDTLSTHAIARGGPRARVLHVALMAATLAR